MASYLLGEETSNWLFGEETWIFGPYEPEPEEHDDDADDDDTHNVDANEPHEAEEVEWGEEEAFVNLKRAVEEERAALGVRASEFCFRIGPCGHLSVELTYRNCS